MNLDMSSSCVVSGPWHVPNSYRDDLSTAGGYQSLSPAVSPFSTGSMSGYNGYIKDSGTSPTSISQGEQNCILAAAAAAGSVSPTSERKSFTNLDTYKCTQEPLPPPPLTNGHHNNHYYPTYTSPSPYAGTTPVDTLSSTGHHNGLSVSGHSPTSSYPSPSSCMYSPWRNSSSLVSSLESAATQLPISNSCSGLSSTPLSSSLTNSLSNSLNSLQEPTNYALKSK